MQSLAHGCSLRLAVRSARSKLRLLKSKSFNHDFHGKTYANGPIRYMNARAFRRTYGTARLTETKVPTVQVDPLTKKQQSLNMIELFANDSGKFIKGYCDRMPIQAVIQFDKVRLFNLRTDDTYQAQVKDRLVTRIRKSSAGTFELRALEALLIATMEHLEADFDRLQPEISDLLERLVYDQTPGNLLLLKDLSDKLESFEADAATVQSALTEVLNNDEDMAQMYLTNAHNGVKQEVSDHSDVETLLESFAQQTTELDNRVQQLKNRISNIEEYMRIHFDSQRNKLMRFNLITSLATLSFGAGAMGASVFGMNLPNGFEHDGNAFFIVSGVLAGISSLFFAGLYRIYAKTKERIPRPFASARGGGGGRDHRLEVTRRHGSLFGGED